VADTARIVIDAGEPFFAGHFPGDPLVPGVVILERVIEEIVRRAGARRWPRRFDAVKFLSPLRPGAVLTIELDTIDTASVHFRCRSGKTVVAAGTVTLRQDNTESQR
jgi:3-hydroxymyristoyl/3-hydroxydecanoyl-(acyl carrier protein) dehydratase